MKCRVCGAESGKYTLCKTCYSKKCTGEIIQCPLCGEVHDAAVPCHAANPAIYTESGYLYELKPSLVTTMELQYLTCIKAVLPEGCIVQAQANLASFIRRTDDARFQNELYRNVDFIITDMLYKPLFLIEINDQTHLTAARRERDEKVSHICEEAGIPIIKLWTSYGVNPDYIRKRINETLASLPVQRIRHFGQRNEMPNMPYHTATPNYVPVQPAPPSVPRQKKGCYVATCVYGSYDCPQVWVLRRYRDEVLASRWYGRVFIRLYYWLSPSFVKLFGRSGLLKRFLKKHLDRLIEKLASHGMDDSPYTDMD